MTKHTIYDFLEKLTLLLDEYHVTMDVVRSEIVVEMNSRYDDKGNKTHQWNSIPLGTEVDGASLAVLLSKKP